MTAAQSFRIFEILNKHFHNDSESKIVVQEIVQIIEAKINAKTEVLASKQDLSDAKVDIIKWLVGTGIAIVGLVVTLVKLIH